MTGTVSVVRRAMFQRLDGTRELDQLASLLLTAWHGERSAHCHCRDNSFFGKGVTGRACWQSPEQELSDCGIAT